MKKIRNKIISMGMMVMLSTALLSGCGKKSDVDNEGVRSKWENQRNNDGDTPTDAENVATGGDASTEEQQEELSLLASKEVYTENDIVSIADAAVGDYVRFGYFEQDDDFENGAEPLSWLVLDEEADGSLVLITEYVIDSPLFNYDWEMCTWDMCDARAMLNGPFYNYAFSKSQQDAILETTLSNKAYSDYIHEEYDENLQRYYSDEQVDCYDGEDTVDKVYYLDVGEVRQYMPEMNDRFSMPTKFAKNRFLWTTDYTLSGEDVAGFWTRTPGVHNTYYCYALGSLDDGTEMPCVEVTASYMGSRPVIRVDRAKAAACENEFSDTADGGILNLDMSAPLDSGYADAIRNAQVGDIITLGAFEQDDFYFNGPEPLTWRVLAIEDGKMLVITEYGIEHCKYLEINDSKKDDEGEWSKIQWEDATIREQLNGEDYYDKMFTDAEKAIILDTTVTNPEYNSFWASRYSWMEATAVAGNDTVDKLFCLDIDEVNTYFADRDGFMEGQFTDYGYSDRLVYATRHAKGSGCYFAVTEKGDGATGTSQWWLRSPSGFANNEQFVSIIDVYGNFNGSQPDLGNTVRPAMWINIP
ncbi:MAG: hypothetical protein IJ224_07930 [Lachnospiraceae bacterium]|nr:hypothetical protein [Lachnospiraceae bacterium]